MDAFTGFAAVSTPQAVYVWNYAKVSTVDIVAISSLCADAVNGTEQENVCLADMLYLSPPDSHPLRGYRSIANPT